MPRWWMLGLVLAVVGCGTKSERQIAEKAAPADPPEVAEALSLADQGMIADGLNVLNAAIEKSPQIGRLSGARATLQHRAGLDQRALEDLNRALEFGPDDAQLLNNRGFVRLSLQDYDAAIADLERALELSPHMASAKHNRGLVSLAQTKFQEAISWFSEALTLGYLPPEFRDKMNWYPSRGQQRLFQANNKAIRLTSRVTPNSIQVLPFRLLLEETRWRRRTGRPLI
jgi:Tfp pilus assembly protein PilF